MPSGREPYCTNAVRVYVVFLGVGPQPTNCTLYIMDLLRKSMLRFSGVLVKSQSTMLYRNGDIASARCL
jgi:hypothetical protein